MFEKVNSRLNSSRGIRNVKFEKYLRIQRFRNLRSRAPQIPGRGDEEQHFKPHLFGPKCRVELFTFHRNSPEVVHVLLRGPEGILLQ